MWFETIKRRFRQRPHDRAAVDGVRFVPAQLIYRAVARVESQRLIVTRLESTEGHEPESGRRIIDYLIKSHVLGATAVHPLPGDLPADPMQIAVASFASFGRRCAEGTFADTTVLSWTTASGQPVDRSAV